MKITGWLSTINIRFGNPGEIIDDWTLREGGCPYPVYHRL
jgi:hypothetical protein